ncbi:hypothetical protein DF211_10075 [Pectobacterium parmentieri]|nr:hypothetical protein DF211_10075 [Pectobacterium parmentieri]
MIFSFPFRRKIKIVFYEKKRLKIAVFCFILCLLSLQFLLIYSLIDIVICSKLMPIKKHGGVGAVLLILH